MKYVVVAFLLAGALSISPVWAADPVDRSDVSGKKEEPVQDAVVAVVNRFNPVRNLSVSQLAMIFSRKVRYWHAVGGNRELSIRAVIGSEHAASLDIFRERILKGGPFLGYEVLAGNAGVLEEVVRDEAAIGLVLLSETRRVTGIRILAVNDQKADLDNLKYPLLLP